MATLPNTLDTLCRITGPAADPHRRPANATTTSRRRGLALVVAASLALAGCFGGGEEAVTEPAAADPLASVPDSAAQSAAGTMAYQRSVSAQAADSREAIDVSALVLPTSDTDEPLAVE